MDLQEITNIGHSFAIKEGAEEAEIYAVRTKTISVYVDDNLIQNVGEKRDLGISIRAIISGKKGESSSSIRSPKDVERCAARAIALSRASPANEKYPHLPAVNERKKLAPKVWDKEVASMSGEDAIEVAKRIVAAALESGREKVPNGVFRIGELESRIANSNGVEAEHRNTMVYLNFGCMSKGRKRGEGIASFMSTQIGSLDPESIGIRLSEKALASSAAKGFKEQLRATAILPPWELGHMLQSSIAPAVSAEMVHRRRSPWTDKMGEEVASKDLAISDDPSDSRGMLSCAFDDEGVPTSKKKILEGGKLRNFVYDSFNASLDSLEPPGNGMRRGEIDIQYTFEHPLRTSVINAVVKPGNKSVEKMIYGVDEGILVEKLASSEVDPITGAFASEIRCGYLIKNGSVEGTIKHALLIGNIYEMIKNVRDIGSDSEVILSFITPSLAFDGVEIVGSS